MLGFLGILLLIERPPMTIDNSEISAVSCLYVIPKEQIGRFRAVRSMLL